VGQKSQILKRDQILIVDDTYWSGATNDSSAEFGVVLVTHLWHPGLEESEIDAIRKEISGNP
jgi:hypothetical protein